MAEYIHKDDAINLIEKYRIELPSSYSVGLTTAKNAIKGIPTADVVPKSEEGAECPTCHGTGRIGTTNWLTKNMTKKQIAEEKAKAIAEHEQRIKTEVAREIFEEIDIIFSEHYGKASEKTDSKLLEPLRLAQRFVISEIYDDLAELKKKYTENENG